MAKSPASVESETMNFNSSILPIATILCLSACQNSTDKIENYPSKNLSHSDIPTWVNTIDNATMIGPPKIVDCTLSGGSMGHCVSFTLKPRPASFEIGPWCPSNISDGPDMSGIWLNDGKVYDADGRFIQNLASFYKDDSWQLFDPTTGKINVTDTKQSCEAAARPDVDPAYQNHCVECRISYLPEGTSTTYVIPLNPEAAPFIAPRVDHAGVGVTFSGARLDASAPLEAILSAHTIAPFDDCGGHINPHVGYHLHAVTDADCLKRINIDNNHASQIGVAMDGYGLFTRLNPNGLEPLDLDVCRGHVVNDIGYHYHVNEPGANAILPCHTGQTGCVLEQDGICDASATIRRGPPLGGRPPPRPKQR